MSKNSGAIGFGGFLLGLGLGYIAFRQLNISIRDLAWVLIILGAAVILSAVIRSLAPSLGLHRVVGGLAGGLILALIITQGFNIFTGGFNFGGSFLPYQSTQTKTYTGSSTKSEIYLKLTSMNGEITLSTWDKAEYSITSTITAHGLTQQDADNNLANLAKDLVSSETATRQSLTLFYNTQNQINNPYQIRVDVKMPSNAVLDLDLTTSNARIVVADVKGGIVNLKTSNSEIRLNNVKANSLTGETSNSQISGSLAATKCSLSTSNSAITIQIQTPPGGDYTLQTSNSNIDVTLSPNAECKLDASTSNSDVTFDIPNFVYSRDSKTSKAGQTPGFDSAQNKIFVDAQTSNSAIRIHR